MYHNYKGTFISIVLLTICDAKYNYNFTLVDVDQYGPNNNSGVLAQSKISNAFESNTLNLPESEVLLGTNLDIAHFLVGDEIFPLKPWPLRPHPGKLLQLLKTIYNYCHLIAKRIIKNAFEILRARWRICRNSMKEYVMVSLCLHNYLSQTENYFTHRKALLVSNWRMIKLRKENGGHRPGKMVLKVDETPQRSTKFEKI